MKRFAVILALACSAPALFAQAQKGPAKLQALIITGQNGHDWKGTTPFLKKALEDSGKFEVRVTEEFRGAGPETLASYDLVVINYFDKKQKALWWGDRANAALVDFVKSGKGLVMYHFSTAAFDGWDEYEKLSGANWRPDNGHHSPAHDFTVKITDSEHVITKGLKAQFPQPKDELYANLKWQPKDKVHVLATAWDDHSLYKTANPKQPTPGPGMDQPMLWVLNYGQGRVFGTALGHDIPAVSTPAFVVTFARGAEWAATGKVTQAIPPEMAR
jgi:uncharacterized protein